MRQHEVVQIENLDESNMIGGSLTLYIEVEDAEKLYTQLQNKVKIYKELHTTWYGQKEFYVEDLNGYILGFASKV